MPPERFISPKIGKISFICIKYKPVRSIIIDDNFSTWTHFHANAAHNLPRTLPITSKTPYVLPLWIITFYSFIIAIEHINFTYQAYN